MTVESVELAPKSGRIQRDCPCRAHNGEPRWRIDDRLPCGVDDAGPETDGGLVALADAADTHHEAQAANWQTRLVGMGDHAWIAQRGALDGVLAGEDGAQQQPALFGKFAAGVE